MSGNKVKNGNYGISAKFSCITILWIMMKHTQRIENFVFKFQWKDAMYETCYLRIWQLHGFSMLACSCMINVIFLYLHRSYVVTGLVILFASTLFFIHALYFNIHVFVFWALSFITLYCVIKVDLFAAMRVGHYTMCMLSLCCMAFEVWHTFTVHCLGLWHSWRCTGCTFGLLCISWLVQSYGIQGYYLCAIRDWWLSIASTCLLVWTVFQS